MLERDDVQVGIGQLELRSTVTGLQHFWAVPFGLPGSVRADCSAQNGQPIKGRR
jgi:hypothetical protein